MAPRGCSSQQPSPSCPPRHFPLPCGHPPSVAEGKNICKSALGHGLAPRTCGWSPSLLGPGGLKSQTWIDFYPLVAGMGRDRRCTPARPVGDWDRTRRCKGEQAKLGLALDPAEKRQAATLGCPLGQEAPRSGPLEAVLRKEETGRREEQVKEKKKSQRLRASELLIWEGTGRQRGRDF